MPVYTIQNHLLSVSVNSFGAELNSVKNSKGKEFIWQADKTVWPRHAPVLFPFVGRLKNNNYIFNGVNYSIPQHGFARDVEFILTQHTNTSVELQLKENEQTLLNYPFLFSLKIKYELIENKIYVFYTVCNFSETDLFFNIGAHPGFNCKTQMNESLHDFYLEFENINELIIEKLNNGLLSGQTENLVIKNNKLKLNPDLFNEDALVLKNKQITSVKLISEISGTNISLNCDKWPYFGIWSKKNNDAFVCLEPWYGITDNYQASGNLNEKEGIIRLPSTQTFFSEFNMQFT